MKFVNAKVMGALLGATVLAAAPVVAQDKSGTNASKEAQELTENGKAVEKYALGMRLAEYARANSDAQAMVVAARLVSSVSVKDGDNKGTIEGGAEQTGKQSPVTAASLLDEAETLAGDDEALLEAVEMARASGSKGAVGGPIRITRYVPGSTTWNVDFNARGGEPLVIMARRDSGVPVSMQVYDENGYLVCQDTSGSAVMGCRINPAWTGPFRVKMANYGGSGTGIVMVTN